MIKMLLQNGSGAYADVRGDLCVRHVQNLRKAALIAAEQAGIFSVNSPSMVELLQNPEVLRMIRDEDFEDFFRNLPYWSEPFLKQLSPIVATQFDHAPETDEQVMLVSQIRYYDEEIMARKLTAAYLLFINRTFKDKFGKTSFLIHADGRRQADTAQDRRFRMYSCGWLY
jgi:hypothetical protein